jgi:hypothetical protein
VNPSTAYKPPSSETAISATDLRSWLTSTVVIVLVIFAANQFATEWQIFRSSAYPTGSQIDFPHYYVAAKLVGSAHPSQHPLYYPAHENKEAVLGRIRPDTEWNQVAHQNGLSDTLHFSAPPIIATLLVPLGKLPYQLAFMVWRILTDVFFFLALSEAGLKFAAGPSNCPVREEVSGRLLRLPFYNDFSESEQDQVTGAVTRSRFRLLSRHAS